MAEQIISPGVFTQENDLSFLPQGIGAIGAAIVGPTEQGPAFVPTLITSFSQFRRVFGDLSRDTYIPQTAREYLKNAGAVTIVRVLSGGGYTFTNGTTEPIAFLATTKASGTFTCLIASDGDNTIGIKVPASIGGGGTAVTMSLDSDQTTDPVGEGANTMAIGTQNMSALNVAEMLTIAINGGTHDNIDYATSGVGTAGVAGVSASHSSNTLTITAETGSIEGNQIELSMIGSGTSMSPSAMTSGSSVLISMLFPSKNSGTGNLGTSFSSPTYLCRYSWIHIYKL